MLPLFRKELPGSTNELAQAIESALRRFVQKDEPIVEVRSRVFPYLDELAINLDRARFDTFPAEPLVAIEPPKPAFEVAAVTVSGRNVSIRGIPLDVRMEGRDVILHKAADANGAAMLLLQDLRDGRLTIATEQLALEKAIAEVATREAERHGIAVEQVRLAMRACGARCLAAEVHLQVRKFLLRAGINISGQIDIDENFSAKVFLKCKSDGAIGSLLCAALNPTFERINHKAFPLALPRLGDIRIRDVRLAVADTVELTADFGS
jgi:hypothetical protein